MISMFLFIAGIIGVVISAIYTFKNKISFFKGICFASLSWLISFVLSVIYEKSVYGISPIDYAIELTFTQLKDIISGLPQELAGTFAGGESIEVFKATILSEIENMKSIYTILYPAIMIITYTLLIFILFMIIKGVLRLMKKDVSFIPKFNEISLNKPVLFGCVFSILMSFLLSDTVIGNAFANVQLLFAAYIVLCGISLMDYYLSRKIGIGVVRFVIYAGFIMFSGGLFGFIMQIAAFMAVLDAFKNFRSESSKWV